MSGNVVPVGSLIPVLRGLLPPLALFSPNELAVLAVSGGPDSLCLLHCFAALHEHLRIRLHVAHVHHGLRGSEADNDAAFVVEQAAALGLPCTVLHLDPTTLRRPSLQAAARLARYAALRSLRASLGGGCIVTAHTEDDQAETLLLHLLRGAGIGGLSGMRHRQGDLVRPLLGISRRAVDAHCRAHGLAPRQDASNLSRKYRRNAIRLDLLPRLEQYNPAVRHNLARTAAALARDADYLHAQADHALTDLLLDSAPDMLTLDAAGLAALHPALRLHTLRAAIAQLAGGTDGWTTEHLESLDALATTGHAGRRWQLPQGVRASLSGRCLVLSSGQHLSPTPHPVALPVPGTAHFGRWRLEASIAPVPPSPFGSRGDVGHYAAWCDPIAVGTPLTVRARLPGDRLRPLGLCGTKKVQDLLVDLKIPREDRPHLPIVSGPHGIIWVVGCALDQHAALTSSSTGALHIQAFVGQEIMQ